MVEVPLIGARPLLSNFLPEIEIAVLICIKYVRIGTIADVITGRNLLVYHESFTFDTQDIRHHTSPVF
jgi:hypothetical protein